MKVYTLLHAVPRRSSFHCFHASITPKQLKSKTEKQNKQHLVLQLKTGGWLYILVFFFFFKWLVNGNPPTLSFYTLQNRYSGLHLKMINRKDLTCKKHHKCKWGNGSMFKKLLRLNFGRGAYSGRKGNFRKDLCAISRNLKRT